MILATGWFIRNNPIAAPDRIDLVPISLALYPKVLTPPPFVQAALMFHRSSPLVMTRVPDDSWIALIGVSGPEFGTLFRTRRTSDDKRRTGHITASPVLSWVRLSILSPFFWFSNVTVTRRARRSSAGDECGISRCMASLKVIPFRRMIFVRPGDAVFVISHARIAKK